MIKSFTKLSSTFSAVKLDFKEDQPEASGSSSSTPSSSNDVLNIAMRPRTTVRLVSTRAIQGRAPIPSLEQQLRQQQRARVAASSEFLNFFKIKFYN
jgi:hypothetical protein